MNFLKENEVLDDLQLNGLKIIQNRSKYCFTSDAVILANFVKAKQKDRLCEIGTGSGVISILINYKHNPKEIVAFEVQPYMADMAKRSITLNNLEDKIKVINSPIQDCFVYEKQESFDVVFSNPPYQKVFSNSPISLTEEDAISKHELKLTLEELLSFSSKLLKFGGKFYIVYDAKRTAELLHKLTINNLAPKKMFFCSPSKDKNPHIVLVESIKGGKDGIIILPTLITNDKNGDYIYTIQKLYQGGIK